jgi:hypothetical protein
MQVDDTIYGDVVDGSKDCRTSCFMAGGKVANRNLSPHGAHRVGTVTLPLITIMCKYKGLYLQIIVIDGELRPRPHDMDPMTRDRA